MEAIESTSVELEPADERTLFRTNDPVEVLEAAKRVAGALKAELEAGGMVLRIGGREHVKAEGWATLGAMLGLTTSIVWSKPLEDGWEARAEVRTLDGRLVGAGEAMCTRAERNWARGEPFALRSMAQTRAASKALRVPLAFVLTLSGYAGTPAEEIEPTPALPAWARPAANEEVMRAAYTLVTILKASGVAEPANATTSIGKRIRARCDDTVPVCVLKVLQDIVDAGLQPAEVS